VHEIGGGLYYFNARWYDASTGRFTSEDPVRDGVNWYQYASANPLRFVDPSGLTETSLEHYGAEMERQWEERNNPEPDLPEPPAPPLPESVQESLERIAELEERYAELQNERGVINALRRFGTRTKIMNEIARIAEDLTGTDVPDGGEVAWIAIAGEVSGGALFGFLSDSVPAYGGLSMVRFWSPELSQGFDAYYGFHVEDFTSIGATFGVNISVGVFVGLFPADASATSIGTEFTEYFNSIMASPGLFSGSAVSSPSWVGATIGSGANIGLGNQVAALTTYYQMIDDPADLSFRPMPSPIENAWWLGAVATGGDYPPVPQHARNGPLWR
jgi:hypothetical protein